MNSRVAWIAGAVFFLLVLVATIPARLVAGWVPLPPGVSLGYVSGTLWHGRIDNLMLMGIRFDDVRFELQPWALLLARLSLKVESSLDGDSFMRGQVWASPLSLGASDLTLQVPAQPLVNLIALPLPQTVAGLIRLDLASARSGSPWCREVQGTFGWDNAQLHNQMLREPLPLGPYTVELGCDKGELTAHVNDAGQLGISADLRLMADSAYRVSALISPAPTVPAEVRQGLALIAEDQGAGFQLEFSGSFKQGADAAP